jgi:hypothetical protein
MADRLEFAKVLDKLSKGNVLVLISLSRGSLDSSHDRD